MEFYKSEAALEDVGERDSQSGLAVLGELVQLVAAKVCLKGTCRQIQALETDSIPAMPQVPRPGQELRSSERPQPDTCDSGTARAAEDLSIPLDAHGTLNTHCHLHLSVADL